MIRVVKLPIALRRINLPRGRFPGGEGFRSGIGDLEGARVGAVVVKAE